MKILLGLLCTSLLFAKVERIALFIGQNEGLKEERPLLYAEKDAERLHDFFKKGQVFSEDNIIHLDAPSVQNIREAFAEVKGRVHELNKQGQETFFFTYYSGHGSKKGLHIDGKVFAKAELNSLFNNINSDMRVMVVDACESGDFLRSKGGQKQKRIHIQKEDELDAKGSIVLSSSAAGELAQESQDYKGGVFTHHFLNGIQGLADYNNDDDVNVLEAFHYAKLATQQENMYGQEKAQNPSYDLNTVGKKIPILHSIQKQKGILTFANLPAGPLEIYDARNASLYSRLYLNGKESIHVQVPRGKYILSRKQGSTYLAADVELSWESQKKIREADFRKQQQSILYARGGKHLDLNPHGFHSSLVWQNFGEGLTLFYGGQYQHRQEHYSAQVLLGYGQSEDASTNSKIDNQNFRGQGELNFSIYQNYYGNLQLGLGASAQWVWQKVQDLRIGNKVQHSIQSDNQDSKTWVYGLHLPLLLELYMPGGIWLQGGVQASNYQFNGIAFSYRLDYEPRLSLGWAW
jgi:hypothetical protein